MGPEPRHGYQVEKEAQQKRTVCAKALGQERGSGKDLRGPEVPGAIPGGDCGNVGRGQLSQGCKQGGDKIRFSVRKITETFEQPEALY